MRVREIKGLEYGSVTVKSRAKGFESAGMLWPGGGAAVHTAPLARLGALSSGRVKRSPAIPGSLLVFGAVWVGAGTCGAVQGPCP